jgi:DNA-binding MarR family transcriptional regulator
VSQHTKLVGEILRAGRRLTVSRDAMCAGFGMSSARLRLLKTIRQLPIPFTISQLARAMAVTRQTARATVRDLVTAGLLRLKENVHNANAPHVEITDEGLARLSELLRAEERWVEDLTRGFDTRLLAQAEWIVRSIRERSEQ